MSQIHDLVYYLLIMIELATLATGICIYVGTAVGHLGQHTTIDLTNGILLLDRYTTLFLQVSETLVPG